MHERHDLHAADDRPDRQHDLWTRATALARSILGRWSDPATRAEREDIAQEAVMALWCYSRGRGEVPVRPLLWTISRRTRGRLLREAARCGIGRCGTDRCGTGRAAVVRGAALRSDALQYSVRDGGGRAAWREHAVGDGGSGDAGDLRDAAIDGGVGWWCDRGAEEACLRVGGALVPREWLLPRLLTQLARLGATNRRIVLAFYGGSTCLALGEHLGLSEEAVKVRLHRSRIVLRKRLEAMARAAGHFER